MSTLCEQATGLNDKQYWGGFSRIIESRRVPFSGSLALTHRCNLGCVHCYVKEETQKDVERFELGTSQWKKIISEIKEEGCLYLLLTGGEPLLREDFAEIYTFAKQNGFLVTVFTNGTLVTDRLADLFRKLPPRLVEISLYGASAETHDRITGVPGSFSQALHGIETLLGQGIHIGLKSVLMTWNADEFPAIERLARSYGATFRLDAQIFPSLKGDHSALELRVSPEQAISCEFADAKMVDEWQAFIKNFHGVTWPEKLYSCGAGTTTFHIDPCGILYPCLMARSLRYDLLSGSFQQGWNETMPQINESKAVAAACGQCRQRLMCGYCPGFFEMENGAEQTPSPYLCALGKLRHERINGLPSRG